MLKGIDPRLNAEVLHALRAMGHGDSVFLVDTNFPAAAIAAETVRGDLLRMDNLSLAAAAEAVLSVLPLDRLAGDFAGRMQVMDRPEEVPPVQAEAQAMIDASEGPGRRMVPIERFAFYAAARQAFAVIQTGERRLFGCIMLRKGVIGPDA